jgi:transposase
LLGRLREGTILLADKAYDADWLRRSIEAAGAAPNIPSKVNRRWHACFSAVLYRERNRIERFLNKDQALPPRRDTLRKACLLLPGNGQARRSPPLAYRAE